MHYGQTNIIRECLCAEGFQNHLTRYVVSAATSNDASLPSPESTSSHPLAPYASTSQPTHASAILSVRFVTVSGARNVTVSPSA